MSQTILCHSLAHQCLSVSAIAKYFQDCFKFLIILFTAKKPYDNYHLNPDIVKAHGQWYIDLEMDPITGPGAMWDYEKGCWKKDWYNTRFKG